MCEWIIEEGRESMREVDNELRMSGEWMVEGD